MPYNPTSDSVVFAFTAPGTKPTGSTTWYAGSWEIANGNYLARCLVGPTGTVTLAAGTYSVWVKITDSPEIPVLEVDTLIVE